MTISNFCGGDLSPSMPMVVTALVDYKNVNLFWTCVFGNKYIKDMMLCQ